MGKATNYHKYQNQRWVIAKNKLFNYPLPITQLPITQFDSLKKGNINQI
jgi:hypothetical protein